MYQRHRSIDEVTLGRMPDMIVHLGSEKAALEIPAKIVHHWKVAPLKGASPEALERLMGDLEDRVQRLLTSNE